MEDSTISENTNGVTCSYLENILNFRDVGETINRFTGKRSPSSSKVAGVAH